MADQYSPRQFFRKTPYELLARYFEKEEVSLDIDWGKLEGKKGAETLFEAFIDLPEEKLASIEVDFHNINALACESGICALANEAHFEENEDFLEGMEAIDGLHAKAIWAFLHEPDYWLAASSVQHAENISRGAWRKLPDLPPASPHLEDEDTDQLAKGIIKCFKKEGKGRRCKVEAYRHVKSGKEYLFAYPEDYGRLGIEWGKKGLSPRASHPAFEIIFVYSEQEHYLDIYAPKNYDAVEELRGIFARTILKLDTLPDGTIDKEIYDLSALAEPDFDFIFDKDKTGIEDIVVTSLRLKLKHGTNRRITLQADTKKNSNAVHDLLSELNLPSFEINQVILKVTYPKVPGRSTNTKTVRITLPNNCNLNHDGKDDVIRKVLTASRIEKRNPEDDGSA